MAVYADVLIFVNFFINFLILELTAKICKDGCKTHRIVAASFIGSLFSMYIFLPESSMPIEIIFKLSVSAVIVLIGFGFDTIKAFLRRISVFFVSGFIYAGFMMAIWAILKPQNLAINNGIVYINISPPVLILSTVVCYLILAFIRRISKKQAFSAKRCKIDITKNQKTVHVKTMLDTGHSLTDSITNYPIIIIEGSVAKNLLGFVPSVENIAADTPYSEKFRLIPFSSVGGHGLLPAFKPDNVSIILNSTAKSPGPVLVAVSNEPLGEDYKAIISPELAEICI